MVWTTRTKVVRDVITRSPYAIVNQTSGVRNLGPPEQTERSDVASFLLTRSRRRKMESSGGVQDLTSPLRTPVRRRPVPPVFEMATSPSKHLLPRSPIEFREGIGVEGAVAPRVGRSLANRRWSAM